MATEKKRVAKGKKAATLAEVLYESTIDHKLRYRLTSDASNEWAEVDKANGDGWVKAAFTNVQVKTYGHLFQIVKQKRGEK